MSEPESGSSPENGRNEDLFKGTVELALPPPVALDRMLQLHKHLKQTPHIDVLNLGGSVDKGITIRILMDSPIELVKVIQELDEVQDVSEEPLDAEKSVPARQGGDNPPIRRLFVATAE